MEIDDATTIEVKVIPSYVQASIIGTDDQGRTIILCPIHHDEAYVEPDGRVVCPTQDAMDAVIHSAWLDMEKRGFLDGIGAP